MKRERAEHPLFHALVVMGSGLSLGCGGVEKDTVRSGSPPSGGGATSSSMDAGGPIGFELGGASSAGGRPGIGGGVPGAGGSNTALCVPAQWDCSDVPPRCDPGALGAFGVSGYYMPTGCRCDVTRPGAGSDCPPEWTFLCRNAITGDNGQTLAVRTPFSCTCVSPTTDCRACDAINPATRDCDVVPRTNGGVDILCGCAYVGLR